MSAAIAYKARAASPVLLVTDIHAAVAWWRDALGFTTERLFGEPPSFAMVKRDGVIVMLAQHAGAPAANNLAASTMWDVYLWVDDAKAVAARLAGAGFAVVRGPEPTGYACEEVETLTPDGHRICLGACW